MPYPTALDFVQWGREAEYGVDVPATSRVALESFDVDPGDTEIARPQIARGFLVRNQGFEEVIRYGANWTASGPLVFEQLQNWLSMLVVGDVEPTGSGPYEWEFVRPITSFPDLDSFTFEKRYTDGTNPIDHAWHYALASALTINADDSGLVSFSANGFARRTQTETVTPSLTMPTPTMVPLAGTQIYIDNSWANLGNTPIEGQVIGWSHTFNNGLIKRTTADGRLDRDFGTHDVNSNEVTIASSLTLLLGQSYAAEEAAARSQALRAVRIEAIAPGDRMLQIDFLAKHEQPELISFGDDSGSRTVTMSFVEAHDAVNFIRYRVTNNVSALV